MRLSGTTSTDLNSFYKKRNLFIAMMLLIALLQVMGIWRYMLPTMASCAYSDILHTVMEISETTERERRLVKLDYYMIIYLMINPDKIK